MNSARRFVSLPVLLAVASTMVGALSMWQTVFLARENQELHRVLLEMRPSAEIPRAEASEAEPAELAKVQTSLGEARRRLRVADDHAQKLATELAIAPAEELKSLGRTEELAAKGVTLVQGIEEMMKAQQTAQSEGRRLNVDAKNMAEWLVNSDMIGEIEADPAAVAEVHSHALRETLGLDEGATRRVRKQLAAEFEELRTQGLDRPHRPTEGQEEWYAKRDRMLLEAAARIEAQISAAQRKPNVIAQIMNLGTGFRTRVQRAPDGSPSLEMYYQAPGSEPIRF